MSRPLTIGEKHMIGTVFPAGILDLNVIRIVKDPQEFTEPSPPFAYVQGDNSVRFPNPGAHFKCWYSDDFSAENNFFLKTLLVHEVAHVWQNQAQIPSDHDFDDFAIDDGLLEYEISAHTQQHLDLHKAAPVGALRVKGQALEFRKPMVDFDVTMINTYITLRGPIDVGHVTAETLKTGWMRRRNYSHAVHDLGESLFWEMNHEEQAEVIVDYFCLLNDRPPEMERYMISTHKRPPIAVYRKVIPFLMG